jgi:arsenate reductase
LIIPGTVWRGSHVDPLNVGWSVWVLSTGYGHRFTGVVVFDHTQSEQPEMTKSITIYGIKNCDTMKKARAWLDSHGVAYNFHDYKSEGIAKDTLKSWSGELGWENLLNRAGTTFRKLPDAEKKDLNERKALSLMLAQPSMIKRPVLDISRKLLIGFKPEIYARELASTGRSRRAGA